jgi:uncharacterized protein (DUF488 family)
VKLFTIGFTKKTAEDFFSRLTSSGAKRLVDVRLNNVSQLAGFAKKDDLKFFSKSICGIDYVHLRELAPTRSMLDAYKKGAGDWEQYASRFLALMKERDIAGTLSRERLDGSCLLCSEDKPHKCHRRLVAEYLREKWGDVEIVHL